MTATITPTPPATAETSAPTPTRSLTAEDRCSRCNAQAYTVWTWSGLDLEMCAHHTNAHADALIAQGFEKTVDNTHLL